VTEAPSSYLDWIVPNGVTQFYGPIGIGKTSLLEGLMSEWKTGNAYLFHPGTHPLDTTLHKDILQDRAQAVISVPSLDKFTGTVAQLIKANSLGEGDLVLVDDTSAFMRKSFDGGKEMQTRMRLLQYFRDWKITTVFGTVTRRTATVPREAQSGKSVAFIVDARYELEEIARGDDHVVLEVWTRKSRTEIPGGVKGRLWLRHDQPQKVRTT